MEKCDTKYFSEIYKNMIYCLKDKTDCEFQSEYKTTYISKGKPAGRKYECRKPRN